MADRTVKTIEREIKGMQEVYESTPTMELKEVVNDVIEKLKAEQSKLKRAKMLEFILGQHPVYEKYCEDLMLIFNFESNRNQRMAGSIISTLWDCFNYGITVGKRMERARHRKGANYESQRI
jgi:hypothetical protein